MSAGGLGNFVNFRIIYELNLNFELIDNETKKKGKINIDLKMICPV